MNSTNKIAQNKPKLLVQLKLDLRRKNYSIKTEEAYTKWVKEYVIYSGTQHPSSLNKSHVEKFLTYLAVTRRVSASTQNQALSALLYLYKNIIKTEIGWLQDVIRARNSSRIPVVFTKAEVREIFRNIEGVPKIVCSLLYGSGLRLGEALSLRIKDINFEYRQITVGMQKAIKTELQLFL
ncbi:MAG: phage integrase N-terminal SAM-like domain-containing protein [Bacteroidetes bacterium]|nr:phage integrase N-terminal SAM-like domain-containing protein [Bacteroidota bacterium]